MTNCYFHPAHLATAMMLVVHQPPNETYEIPVCAERVIAYQDAILLGRALFRIEVVSL